MSNLSPSPQSARHNTALILGIFAWIAAVWLIAFTAAGTTNHDQALARSPNPLDRWDAAFYKSYATGQAIDRQTVVTPLYGWLVGAFIKISGLTFAVTSMIVSTGLTIIAIWLTIQTIGESHPRLKQKTLLLLMLSGPASFILLAPYPVSLLLLLTVLVWRGLRRRNFWITTISAMAAPLAHPTGLVVTIVALAFIISWRSWRASWLALTATAVAIFIAISTEFVAEFLSARVGYTSFEGIRFWTFGSWWLTRSSSPAIGALMMAAIIHTGVGAARALHDGWRGRGFLTWTLAGLTGTTVVTGLWIGLSRYLLPSPAPVIALASTRPLVWRLMVITGFGLQALWIWTFVGWQAFI